VDSSEEDSVEDVSEEAHIEAPQKKPYRRNVNTGRLLIPSNWPKWKKQCGAVKGGRPPCRRWAVIGMPTCKFHGSGGEYNRQLGQMRYLAWVAVGGPQDMPIEHACRLTIAWLAEMITSENHPEISVETRIKAAMWLIDSGRST
jgi:hypothetical protein